MTFLYNYRYSFDGWSSEPLSVARPSYQVGVSLLYFFTGRLYGEVNTDFVLSHATTKDFLLGMIVPSIGIGWQF